MTYKVTLESEINDFKLSIKTSGPEDLVLKIRTICEVFELEEKSINDFKMMAIET